MNVRVPLSLMGNLWRNCAKVCDPVELSFGMVSAVGPGIGVLDGVHVPQGEREVLRLFLPHWFEWCFECILSVFLKQKCIRLVREKLTIFPHGQYINGIAILASQLGYFRLVYRKI